MEAYSGKIAPGYSEPVIVKLDPAFIDQRGLIQNVCTEAVGGVSVLRSRPGTVRSEHWHRTDWHYLYVVSGCMQYQCRPVGAERWPDPVTIAPGECVYTPPMVEHRTSFPIETVLVSASMLGREHDAHEADVVRVK